MVYICIEEDDLREILGPFLSTGEMDHVLKKIKEKEIKLSKMMIMASVIGLQVQKLLDEKGELKKEDLKKLRKFVL